MKNLCFLGISKSALEVSMLFGDDERSTSISLERIDTVLHKLHNETEAVM